MPETAQDIYLREAERAEQARRQQAAATVARAGGVPARVPEGGSAVPMQRGTLYGAVASAYPQRGPYYDPWGPMATHAVAVPAGKALGFPSDAPIVFNGNPMNPWQVLNSLVLPWMQMGAQAQQAAPARRSGGGGGGSPRKAPATPPAQQPAAPQAPANPQRDVPITPTSTYYGVEGQIGPAEGSIARGTAPQLRNDPQVSLSEARYRGMAPRANASYNPFRPNPAATVALDSLNDMLNASLNGGLTYDANAAARAAQRTQNLGIDRSGFWYNEQLRRAAAQRAAADQTYARVLAAQTGGN